MAIRTSPATPSVTINVSDPSGAYTGFDDLTPVKAIPAHSSRVYTDVIVVTGQGASYATSFKASIDH